MNILVNENAKAFSQDAIEINRPIEDVYNKILDINEWPIWQTTVKSVVVNGPLEEGSKFTWIASGMKIVSELHTVNRYTELGWTGRMYWIGAIHNWYFEKSGNVTKVTVKESLSGFGASLMRKLLKQGMRKSLIELKMACEV